MDAILTEELDGQTSINELLDEPVGASPVQLALPIHFQLAVAVRQGS
ncbi:hypothetical protein J2X01_003930 [Arthrobacter ginsengisoli]|uniref:Uncharacterized protein n=1 Tax=Arthrobacter ginsengisoli TaxID=1356565 RepID=A0ABU1UHE8_9MICC|nr:hypothetical protein [Arthrobacter ginsengisoli]MDR7084617.1 hypothetical protein [Arthrobacter ginsengisoli]